MMFFKLNIISDTPVYQLGHRTTYVVPGAGGGGVSIRILMFGKVEIDHLVIALLQVINRQALCLP